MDLPGCMRHCFFSAPISTGVSSVERNDEGGQENQNILKCVPKISLEKGLWKEKYEEKCTNG